MTVLLTSIFALLTLALWGGILGILVSEPARQAVAAHAVGIASAVTGTATMGSLYLSEVAGFVPCELCWAQRIAMYPLAVVALVALVRRRTDLWGYAVPLAVMGLAISIWHVVVQRIPGASTTCDPLNPCSAIWVERFGVVTIPVMAGTAFLTVLLLAWTVRRAAGRDADERADGTHAGAITDEHATTGHPLATKETT